MIVEFVAQIIPSAWILIPALLIVALLISDYLDPELVEVYVGDARLVVATLAVVLVVIALVDPGAATLPLSLNLKGSVP